MDFLKQIAIQNLHFIIEVSGMAICFSLLLLYITP
jgi:hypothetical protein